MFSITVSVNRKQEGHRVPIHARREDILLLRGRLCVARTSILGYGSGKVLDQARRGALEKELPQLSQSRCHVLAFAGRDDLPVLTHLDNGYQNQTKSFPESRKYSKKTR